jgi:hypothetical protein
MDGIDAPPAQCWALSSRATIMKLSNGFIEEREALDRATRLLEAMRSKDERAIQRELSCKILLEGIASIEAVYGLGLDFRAGDTYVRVYGAPIALPRNSVGVHVAALGRLLNVYCDERVIAIAVDAEDYLVTGTT